MARLREHITLGDDVRHLVLLDHVDLAQLLHRVDPACVTLAHEPDLAERTTADDGEHLEVRNLHDRRTRREDTGEEGTVTQRTLSCVRITHHP